MCICYEFDKNLVIAMNLPKHYRRSKSYCLVGYFEMVVNTSLRQIIGQLLSTIMNDGSFFYIFTAFSVDMPMQLCNMILLHKCFFFDEYCS